MHAPELLILDEPTGGLDPLLQRQFIAMTREVKQAGRTVFMSSHVLSEVQQTADRVGIIRDGRLVTVERVEALRERAVDPPGLPLALVPGW
jgi:ABC-2 type transport system ATP-binding protein